MPVEITTVADRPELANADIDVHGWPEFMRHNRVSEAYFAQVPSTFPETCLIATVGDRVVADAHAVQFARRSDFPPGGWEQVVVRAFTDVRRGVGPDSACALHISVAQDCQNQGIAALMLAALRQAAADVGLDVLDAPVRPTHKHLEPRTSMAEYAARTGADGLPCDPWLRTHVRAGGKIAGIAPASWVVAGSLAEWRSWTGLPFDRSGPVEVEGGLVPVDCDVAADRAVYVEPNVWVRHEFSTA
ncbi:N-acetyltransferase [Kribbella sp. NBC_00662]|uniref:GNAT family N-acetyltransferase n=1 Tax=Kribbella sp. NBC_00662 TaxID=2975969 RepID=UPI0032506F63